MRRSPACPTWTCEAAMRAGMAHAPVRIGAGGSMIRLRVNLPANSAGKLTRRRIMEIFVARNYPGPPAGR
jgi:hypothetical protein